MSWRIIFANISSWFIYSKADKYSVTGSRISRLNFKDCNPCDISPLTVVTSTTLKTLRNWLFFHFQSKNYPRLPGSFNEFLLHSLFSCFFSDNSYDELVMKYLWFSRVEYGNHSPLKVLQ